METICIPDISGRPLELKDQGYVSASPEDLFEVWTSKMDLWFAAPGTLITDARVNGLFFFEAHREGKRHPHYGRFLTLDKPRVIEKTWISEGTKGTETFLRVEFVPEGDKTLVKIHHQGFLDEESRDAHKEGWPHAYGVLDQTLKA